MAMNAADCVERVGECGGRGACDWSDPDDDGEGICSCPKQPLPLIEDDCAERSMEECHTYGCGAGRCVWLGNDGGCTCPRSTLNLAGCGGATDQSTCEEKRCITDMQLSGKDQFSKLFF